MKLFWTRGITVFFFQWRLLILTPDPQRWRRSCPTPSRGTSRTLGGDHTWWWRRRRKGKTFHCKPHPANQPFGLLFSPSLMCRALPCLKRTRERRLFQKASARRATPEEHLVSSAISTLKLHSDQPCFASTSAKVNFVHWKISEQTKANAEPWNCFDCYTLTGVVEYLHHPLTFTLNP